MAAMKLGDNWTPHKNINIYHNPLVTGFQLLKRETPIEQKRRPVTYATLKRFFNTVISKVTNFSEIVIEFYEALNRVCPKHREHLAAEALCEGGWRLVKKLS